MNTSTLVRACWFVALSQVVLIAAPATAQSASTQLGARSEATIQIRVSVAPRFITNNLATTEVGGVSTDVTSNAPSLRYNVIAQKDMTERARLQSPTGRAQSEPSSTLLLIVPD
jgi:hypothetical protein